MNQNSMVGTQSPAPGTAINEFMFDTHNVRVVMRDGDPWFVAKDVCDVLEHSNSRMALDRLDTDEKGVSSVYTLGGVQELAIINESGLYSLVLTSRKPDAKRFKKWITSEVIPSIRKTGGYNIAQAQAKEYAANLTRMQILQMAIESESERIRLAEIVEKQAPKVEGFERITAAEGEMSITAAAKALQVPVLEFSKFLRDIGWTYYRPGSTQLLAFADKISKGVLKQKVEVVTTGGPPKVINQVMVTSRGLTELSLLKIDGKSQARLFH